MPVLGITGGIATGKSTFARCLPRYLPGRSYDADEAARNLLADDLSVREAVRDAFGAEIFRPDGELDRTRLRELVFADASKRSRLEAILHPLIRRSWLALAAETRQAGTWLFVDLPLLYETGAEPHFDRVVVVGCSPANQAWRLENLRKLPEEIAGKILAAQLDLLTKTKKADHLIWNDSGVSCLESQAELLGHWLRQCYG